MNKHRKHAASAPARRWKRNRGPLGFSIPEAGAMIGLGRDASYAAALEGQIPTIEFGKGKRKLKIVPRIPWLRKLGAENEDLKIEAPDPT
jgi:hypothetical protein